MWITFALASVAAFGVAFVLTRVLADSGVGRRLLDHPNDRSLHREPRSRAGGIAIVAAILTGCAGLAIEHGVGTQGVWLLGGAGAIAAVSFADDLSRVSPAVRLLVHLGVAGLLAQRGLLIDAIELPGLRWTMPGGMAVAVTCLYTVWLINLYNFMDGMDGFAGGMAGIGFAAFALLSMGQGVPLFTGVCLVVAAAALGFLPRNFPPAKIFMGDVGSSVFGYLVAVLSLWAHASGLFPLWISVLVFSPFIVDATVTLGRRAGRRERVWQAHKTHYYQRLVQLGWGHRKTVLWEYALMLLCAAGAWFAMGLGSGGQWLLLCAAALTYTALMRSIPSTAAR